MSQQTDPNLDDLDDDDQDDGHQQQQQQGRKPNDDIKELRRKAKQADRLAAELDEMKRERAIEKAALKTPDGKDLSERQIKALLATHDGEMTAEALRASAVELGFATPSEEQQQLDDDMQTQQRIAAAAAGGGQTNAGIVTPADVAEWSTERTIRFKQKYPTEFEALKRGEEVMVGAAY